MPNRILWEAICTSPDIDTLSTAAECFFYRLMTAVDDFGRFDGRPPVLRARCMPLRSVSERQIDGWLDELERAHIVRRYVSDGRPYLFMPAWAKYQRTRAETSKFPPPPSSDSEPRTSDVTPPSSAAVFVVEVATRYSKSELDSLFTEFWATYPRKVGKRAARAAFEKALERASASTILAGAQRFALDPNRDPAFTAHPTTWLNQDRWDDDSLPNRNGSRRPTDTERRLAMFGGADGPSSGRPPDDQAVRVLPGGRG